jgi:hypothetical protein
MWKFFNSFSKIVFAIFFGFLMFFNLNSKLRAVAIGDVNGNGRVDIIDIGIIIDNYAKSPIQNPNADLNSDGQVNIIDIGVVIDNYGSSASPSPSSTASQQSYKIAAVGDIVCGTADIGTNYPCQAGATANTIKQISPQAVLIVGDIQYESGSLSDFNNYYDVLYGSFKNITKPVPGNHEYGTAGAAGYFTYFGAIASPQEPSCRSNCKGYYSFDLGNWHLIALNGECAKVPGGCGVGSPQETWLKSDLSRVPAGKCILAYWHRPRFSSGHDGNSQTALDTLPFWNLLYSARADIVLGGHSHSYERFDLQDPTGRRVADGIRQFVVGMGGRDFTGFWNSSGLPNSQIKNNNTFGVLKLTLNPNSYDWQFMASTGINGYRNGSFTDSGTQNCH